MAIERLNSTVRSNVIQSRNDRKERQKQKSRKSPSKKPPRGRVDELA